MSFYTPRPRGSTYEGRSPCGRCGSHERYRSSNNCVECAKRRSAEQTARLKTDREKKVTSNVKP